jgi:hypothetical protein
MPFNLILRTFAMQRRSATPAVAESSLDFAKHAAICQASGHQPNKAVIREINAHQPNKAVIREINAHQPNKAVILSGAYFSGVEGPAFAFDFSTFAMGQFL